jgi:hypothetical protein
MTVQNFHVEVNIDGRNTPLAGGPRSKDGGFDLTVYIRDENRILRALSVTGTASSDGTLTLRAAVTSDADSNLKHDIGSIGLNTCGAADFEITTKR